ncbi:MAG: hypothetical protein AAB654_19085, partial [Acidobacteriota bacterium]
MIRGRWLALALGFALFGQTQSAKVDFIALPKSQCPGRILLKAKVVSDKYPSNGEAHLEVRTTKGPGHLIKAGRVRYEIADGQLVVPVDAERDKSELVAFELTLRMPDGTVLKFTDSISPSATPCQAGAASTPPTERPAIKLASAKAQRLSDRVSLIEIVLTAEHPGVAVIEVTDSEGKASLHRGTQPVGPGEAVYFFLCP